MTVKDILNLVIPENFGSDEDGEETSSIEDVYDQLDNSVQTTYGASKFIIFIDDKTVVKIPFNGCFWWDEEYERNKKYEDNWRFDYFINENYCEIEAAVYDKAVEAGVEKFFASTQYYGKTKNNVPVSVSERVFTFFDNARVRENTDKISEDSWSRAKELKNDFRVYISEEWLARAIEFYGKVMVDKLVKFILDENIRDLHSDNIGFREDGSPVILDYSSYDEN